MYMEIRDSKNEIVFKSDLKSDIINNLMFYLFEIARKNKAYKLEYKYNWTNLQTITIVAKSNEIYSGKKEIIFYNIPTRLSCLDTDTILK